VVGGRVEGRRSPKKENLGQGSGVAGEKQKRKRPIRRKSKFGKEKRSASLKKTLN
jgi:hypothetical protein